MNTNTTCSVKMSQKSIKLSPIAAMKFYGNYEEVKIKIEAIKEIEKSSSSYWMQHNSRRMPQRLLGPSQDWSEFYKQADALVVANAKNTETSLLSTFVYERTNGRRRFIVAHPEVYWWYFNQRHPEQRCAYEVIPEGAPCSLYLDLEFEKHLNPDKDGPHMTQTLIEIFSAYLKKYWDFTCTEKNVLNLDSTTLKKFSRHLIFRFKDIAFKNNIHVGRLVKTICAEIEDYLMNDCSVFHDVLSYFKREDLNELYIESGKKRKLFIDTGVYTRNRHFRIYKATKWGKLSHLIVAPECKYVTLQEHKDKELGIFLESLIAYLPYKKDLILLEMNEDSTSDNVRNFTQNWTQSQRSSGEEFKNSSIPAVDKFISKLVHPGMIRSFKYFENSNTIVYDIIGNRFCANIGRPHKSNGIYWVADLKRQYAYQKCYDQEDCLGFKSVPIPFPIELCFLLDEEDDEIFCSIPDNFEDSIASSPERSV